jgi:hypothetical protein
MHCDPVRHGLVVMVLSLCDPKGVAARKKNSCPVKAVHAKKMFLFVDSFYDARCKRIAHVHDPMECLHYFIIYSFNYLKKHLAKSLHNN